MPFETKHIQAIDLVPAGTTKVEGARVLSHLTRGGDHACSGQGKGTLTARRYQEGEMHQLTPIEPVPPLSRDMDLSSNRLPSTNVLGGETITLEYDDGAEMTLRLAATHVAWEIRDGDGVSHGNDTYDAVELQPNLFFLHFVSATKRIGFSHVIDRDRGRAITGWDVLAEDGGAPELHRFLRPARLAGCRGSYEPIAESRELIGRRAYCEYSEEAALEHIYVNSDAIIWQWLKLPDDPRFGMLKTEIGIEAVSMRKVRDDVFLLVLNDGGPVGLTLLMDFLQARNVGCLFGIGRSGIVDRLVGAKIVLLNQLSYPSGYDPG